MSSRLSRFLRIFLPILAVVMVGAYLNIQTHSDARLSEISGLEAGHVHLAAAMLDRRSQIVRKELEYLVRHNTDPVSGHPSLEHMERDFIDLMHVRPVYDQMRWLDARGQEILRVDLVKGKPSVVPREKLQNKANRYYFSEAINLPPGQIYASPIDLNVEGSVIEVPHKPMLRLAAPIADQQGEKLGVVVLNYLAEELFAHMEALVFVAADRLLVANAGGYFLHAPNPEDKWGFMFNDPQRSLATRYPESWARLRNETRGQFVDAMGLWTFERVYPVLADNRSIEEIRSNLRRPVTADMHAEALHVLTFIPHDRLAGMVREGVADHYVAIAWMILLLALGTLVVERAIERRRLAEQRFKDYFEHAMIGMAIVSSEKRWLTVNPTLCQILQCPAERLLATNWAEVAVAEDRAGCVAGFERLLSGAADVDARDTRYLRSDGKAVDVHVSTQAVRRADGSLDYVVAIIEDITQKRLAGLEKQKSLETLRGFIDHLPGVAFIKDDQSRVRFANQRFGEFLGRSPDELTGCSTEELFPGELGRHFIADDRRILAGGQADIYRERVGEQTYESIKFPIRHADGTLELGGLSMDISERTRSEALLELFARRAAVLLELAEKSSELDERAFMTYVLDQAQELTASQIGFMHLVNHDEETIELVAWSKATLEKYCTAGFDNHYPISQAGIWADAARLKRPVIINDYANAENKRGLPQGHSALTRLISVPVMEDDAVRMMTGVGNKDGLYNESDVETLQLLGSEVWRIVRRQRAEKALKVANQVVNASPVICFRWGATEGWPVVFVSENVKQWGYTADELQAGKPSYSELVHPDDLEWVLAQMSSNIASGLNAFRQEYRIVTAENQVVWVIDRTSVRRDAAGNIEHFDGVVTDVSEAKARQLALADSLAEQKTLNKRLEEAHNQLLQSEKMASIGQLAAGVAHELNNPIGFVHSNLGTLDGYVRDLMEIIAAYDQALAGADPASDLVHRIHVLKEDRDFDYIASDIGHLLHESKDGLSRVRKIVQDLKSFSHVSEQEWQWANLHEGIDSTLNIVWNELKYKCTVVKEYGDLPKVFCMISQLNQVFMNLLVNAGQAIETKGTISIRSTRLGDGEVSIEIRDTGKGIAPEHLNRLFEPFFTTKPVGKGTGLGLSLAYGIVDKHHGRIEVESTPGQGTTFRLILPVNQAAGTAGQSQEIQA